MHAQATTGADPGTQPGTGPPDHTATSTAPTTPAVAPPALVAGSVGAGKTSTARAIVAPVAAPAGYDDILALHDAAGADRAALEAAGADHAHIASGDDDRPLWQCGQDLVTCQRGELPMSDLARLVWRAGLARHALQARHALHTAALQTMADWFGLPAVVTVEEYTAHAEISAAGLRFEYRAGDRPGGGPDGGPAAGRLELVEPCEVCRDGLRRAVIGPDDPWADLGEALARPRDMYAGPWSCWTCDEREAEAAAEAARYETPAPPAQGVGERIATALEDLAGHLAAIRDGELPHSDQLAGLHDLLDERLDRLDDRLADLVDAVVGAVGAVDEPGPIGRAWRRLRGLLPRRPARARPDGGPGFDLDQVVDEFNAVMAARYAQVRAQRAAGAGADAGHPDDRRAGAGAGGGMEAEAVS